jgi:hypothetical protein
VTKRHSGRSTEARCSSVACAMATPSCVEVPRPSSSITTREEGVADARIEDTSLRF